MRPKNIFYLLLCIFLVSCGEDRRKEYAEKTEFDRWIESKMREEYYWYKDMPPGNKLNYFEAPDVFFPKLLSKEDGNGKQYYSTIENLSDPNVRSISNVKYSYGFDYGAYTINTNKQAARVFYTAPNSPATDAGLKRGDWILKIDTLEISSKNINDLRGGDAIKVVTGTYNPETEKIETVDTLSLPAARPVEDNPVYERAVHIVNGKKVGYLAYNHFTAGTEKEGEAKIYDKALRNASEYFKGQGVEEFVLDLRYNNGGSLSSALLLCAILGPSSIIGERIGYVEYNDKKSPREEDRVIPKDIFDSGGANLNLNTLYVLTSKFTASASEVVIHFLEPYMTVVLIGTDNTEGKNVGSIEYKNPDYPFWVLHPIICKIFNKDEKTYEEGFKPKHSVKETIDDPYLPLGDKDETMLKNALKLISGEGIEEKETSRSAPLKMIGSSLDCKATNGVVLD